ncbi:MAG TPA: response regulator transcription factor [Acetobacteraceae bacterium]|nr:response regulator transcription factor [Acetobacteraceae bacterium]
MSTRILLLDPQPADGATAAAWLSGQGFPAEAWSEPDAALSRLTAADPPWLVLLHRRLLTDPGLGLLGRVRTVSPVPAILRAMDADDEAERVLALESGADDYLQSTASGREVLARIRCVLRRARGTSAATAGTRSRFVLCLKRRELFGPDGESRNLTSAEFDLLQLLARQQGMPVAREALSLAVLRRPYHPEDRALDNLVLRLRRKLSDEGDAPRLIKSVRGIGYVFTGFDNGETSSTEHAMAPVGAGAYNL